VGQYVCATSPFQVSKKLSEFVIQTFAKGGALRHIPAKKGVAICYPINLSAEVVEGNILLLDSQVVEHLEDCRVHHWWAADVIFNLFWRRMFA
jgi:hypothetical protein